MFIEERVSEPLDVTLKRDWTVLEVSEIVKPEQKREPVVIVNTL